MILQTELKEDSDYILFSDGKIYSKKTKTFLKGMVDGSGYHCYCLRTNGKSWMPRTNRLVAEYFVKNPNPKEFTVVNHIDHNKLNNDMTNLEWVTPSDNVLKWYEQSKVKKRGSIYSNDNDPDEKWIGIKDYDRYEISNLGQVRVKKTHRIMRPDKGAKYPRVTLINNDGKRKHLLIHRLAYMNFNKDWDLDGFVIDHIDTNPKNNKIENLQKITPSENTKRQARFQK